MPKKKQAPAFTYDARPTEAGIEVINFAVNRAARRGVTKYGVNAACVVLPPLKNIGHGYTRADRPFAPPYGGKPNKSKYAQKRPDQR